MDSAKAHDGRTLVERAQIAHRYLYRNDFGLPHRVPCICAEFPFARRNRLYAAGAARLPLYLYSRFFSLKCRAYRSTSYRSIFSEYFLRSGNSKIIAPFNLNFLKIQQSNKISILETVELVRERAHVYQRVFERKLEVKSAALFQRRFKPSLKLHSE